MIIGGKIQQSEYEIETWERFKNFVLRWLFEKTDGIVQIYSKFLRFIYILNYFCLVHFFSTYCQNALVYLLPHKSCFYALFKRNCKHWIIELCCTLQSIVWTFSSALFHFIFLPNGVLQLCQQCSSKLEILTQLWTVCAVILSHDVLNKVLSRQSLKYKRNFETKLLQEQVNKLSWLEY